MKRTCLIIVFFLLCLFWPTFPASAAVADEQALSQEEQSASFDLDAQLDAIGRDELESGVPKEARVLMREAGADKLSVSELLQLSPGDFFSTVWRLFLNELQKPLRTLAAVIGMIVLTSLVGVLKTAESEDALSRTFTLVAILCVVTAVMAPIIECVTATAKLIKDTALFMLTYIPIFSAAVAAAGAPVTGATYNMFLFATCQVVSQVLANTLVPLMGVYLALCVAGSLVPELNIDSATSTVKSIVSWSLGFALTLFAALLSVQTMVSASADTVTVRAAKFVVGSFVPVVGAALSEAYSAAQGYLKLIRATIGAYGIIVAAFTFLPVLIRVLLWQLVTRAAVVVGDILGAPRVAALLRACASVLAILMAVILCFALFIIVSTAIVMAAGAGG